MIGIIYFGTNVVLGKYIFGTFRYWNFFLALSDWNFCTPTPTAIAQHTIKFLTNKKVTPH